MKNYKLFGPIVIVLTLLASCASVPPNEKAGVTIGALYKFSSTKLDSSLYVKFLPESGGKQGLLFTTLPNSQKVSDISTEQSNVFKKSSYNVDKEGRVSFRYYQTGSFKELVKHHKYFISGQQNGDTSAFSYRLDFKQAKIVK